MRCDEVAALLPSLVDGVDETNLVVERHVQECLRCQTDLVRYRKLVRSLADPEVGVSRHGAGSGGRLASLALVALVVVVGALALYWGISR